MSKFTAHCTRRENELGNQVTVHLIDKQSSIMYCCCKAHGCCALLAALDALDVQPSDLFWEIDEGMPECDGSLVDANGNAWVVD